MVPALLTIVPTLMGLVLGIALPQALAQNSPPVFAPRVISTGVSHLQCAKGRAVHCVVESGLDHSECELVENAVNEINAVIPELLSYKGEISVDAANKLWEFNDSIFVAAAKERLPADKILIPKAPVPLALTRFLTPPERVCIPSVSITIFYQFGVLKPEEAQQVTTHEMMHALGFNHADPYTPFSTIMRPSLSIEKRPGLSESDKLSLRTVYAPQ